MSTITERTTTMNGAIDMTEAERDTKLAAALRGALQAMMLTHGSTITMAGVSGSLNFERQMLELTEALMLLAVETDELSWLSETTRPMD